MTFAATMCAVLALLLVFWTVGAYNRLVSLRSRFKASFFPVDVQLKHRYELIPNLVETVKDSLKVERALLETLIAARNSAVTANARAAADPTDAAAVQQMDAADAALSAALAKMLALAQTNTDLQTNQNMRQLTDDLAATEARIAFARQAYNATTHDYNHSLEQFPGSVIANMFAFKAGGVLRAGE